MFSGRARLLGVALALVALSCTDKTVISPPGKGPSVTQASFTQTPGAVTFTAPLGAGVANPANFDPTVGPTVSICVWSGSACTGAPVAQFTPTANTTVGQYETSWNLMSTSLLTRKTYRIRVMQGTTELGAALVDVVRGRWALTRTDGTLAALAAATDLPIRFHIERPAPVLTSIAVTLTPPSIIIGQNSTATAQGIDQYGGSISTGPITWSSSDANLATVNSAGVVSGVAAGTPSIIATAGSVIGQQTITVNAPPAIKINEIESNQGVPGDWVELYNTTSAAVDISGWKFRDNDVSHNYVFPSGTIIPAGGYYVIEELAMDFGLGGADDARLYHTFGALVDSHTWTAHAATTYARCPNGTGAFEVSAASTKGAANSCVVPGAAIKVNEVESNLGVPGDWIELFNSGATSVNISGFIVKDNDDTHSYAIPAGTTLAAGAYYIVEEAQLGFGLGSADAARVFNTTGTLLDIFSWTAHASTTYGRCPNGTGAFTTTNAVTKGAANDCGSSGLTVKINEIESNNGVPGDWVELYNTGTSAVNLTGFVVKDNDDTHIMTFPAGSSIAPGQFLVVEEAQLGYGLGAADAVRLYNAAGTQIDTHAWTAHATTTYGRCPDGTGAFQNTSTSTKGAANDCGVGGTSVKVNEVESDLGVPGDWIELFNTGATPVSLAGFMLKDNDDTHVYTFPVGATIAAGAFLVVDEAQLGFGLGGADAARLFNPGGTLLDIHSWTAHATTTYGRCPDGTGAFITTFGSSKGAANICAPPTSPWPGTDDVHTVDGVSVFGSNLSGLVFESAGVGGTSVLWAAKNGPGTLYRLIFSGGIWTPDPSNGWSAGKAVKYTDGTGNPDAEGVTFAAGGSAGGMYISTERNNDISGTSRNVILRFDPNQPGSTLTATHQWDITSDIPVNGANLGLEAITWIPDSYLTSANFFDEAKGHAYLPSEYPNHGTGLFFVGVEADGKIYGYALDHTGGGFTRVATITTGFPGVMDLSFDRETNYLWAICDDGCQNTSGVFEINPATGRFTGPRRFARPSTMPNLNNEGFAIATLAECVAGFKPVFWSDDAETGGHSIRSASLPCGPISSANRRPVVRTIAPVRRP